MELLIILILILFNGFFALSEIALVSVKKTKMEQLASRGNKRAKIILKLLENPENFLSSVQVGITLIGIVAGAYGGAALTGSVEAYLANFTLIQAYAHEIALAIVIGGITYFSIVVGELVPKSIALKNAEGIALFAVPIIKYFTFVTYPFVKLLSFSTRIILGVIGVKEAEDEKISEEDLIFMLKAAGKQGVLEKDETQLHHNLFFFADQRAKSMMTEISEVEWIDSDQPKEAVLGKIKESNHSCFLVSGGSIENVKGIVKTKDFLKFYNTPNFDLKKVITEPIFIHQSTPAFKILNIFKSKKQYFAVVVDEFGSVKGILTLHDIFEAIIGNLPDEDEEDEPSITKRSEGGYLLDGSMLVYEVNQYFQQEIIKDDSAKYTTVAGFILQELEVIPKPGDKLKINHCEFEILDMDGIKIDKVLMILAP